jgi:hypothetical protein
MSAISIRPTTDILPVSLEAALARCGMGSVECHITGAANRAFLRIFAGEAYFGEQTAHVQALEVGAPGHADRRRSADLDPSQRGLRPGSPA